MADLQLDGVWKRYSDGTEAVKDLSLHVADGEFVILVGPSGCGKSTALRMVAGLEEISDGTLRIGGKVVNELTPKERDIAMVFQNYALYPHMTVADNIGFALKLAKVSKDEIRTRVEEAGKMLGLTEYLHRKPRALSGGQRQRVAMGRAIVRNPQVFLMDEPLSNLDAKLRVAMRAEIAQLQNRLAATTLYVTHDQVEAMTMGDRVAVLKRGELQQVAPPQELYDNPANIFVAGFIGSPAMNLAEGRLEKVDGRLTAVVGDLRLDVPEKALRRYSRASAEAGKMIGIGMRPEHFERPDSGAYGDGQTFKAKVLLVEALGSEALVHFHVAAPPILSEDTRDAVENEETFEQMTAAAYAGNMMFTAKLDPGPLPATGQDVEFAFRTEYLNFFDLTTGEALR